MGDMRKECGDLTAGVVRGADTAEAVVEADGLQESGARVEVLPLAAGISLVDDPIKKLVGNNVGDNHVVGRRRGIARALLASSTAIIVPGAAVSPPAAAQVRGTAAVLRKGVHRQETCHCHNHEER